MVNSPYPLRKHFLRPDHALSTTFYRRPVFSGDIEGELTIVSLTTVV